MFIRRLLPATLVACAVLFALPALAQTAPATCDPSLANNYVCNNATNGQLVVGNAASGDGAGNIVIGNSAHGIDDANLEAGVGAGQVIIGDGASGTGLGDTVIGFAASATGTSSPEDGVFPGHNWGMTAIGSMAHADGLSATALGAGSTADSANATAVGEVATVTAGAANGTAVGHDSWVDATNGTAVGDGAQVTSDATNSVALGAGSVADEADTVSVGTDYYQRRVTNVADGVSPNDAVNVSQLDEALESANNYTNIKSTQVLNQANAYTDFRVGQLDGRIKRAIAIATAQAQMVATYAGADPSSANRVAVGTGWEGGYGAMAVGYQHVSVESKHRITWNVGASISGGDGSVGGGVGFSW